MAITYTWSFDRVEVSTVDEPKDLAVIAHWRLTAVEAEGLVSSAYGSANLGEAAADYTPFNEITKEQLAGWVIDTMENVTEDDLKKALADQIEAQKKPKTVPKVPSGWS